MNANEHTAEPRSGCGHGVRLMRATQPRRATRVAGSRRGGVLFHPRTRLRADQEAAAWAAAVIAVTP